MGLAPVEGITLTVEQDGQPSVTLQPKGTGLILRTELQQEKVDVYTFKGKIGNCNGYGQCGLCQVEVVEGMENLGPRTAAEEAKLSNKPDTYRLACQTTLEGGAVRIRTKPN